MVRDETRWWWLPDGEGGLRKDLPLSFSIRATKPADLTGRAAMLDDYLKANLASWDEAVGLHVGSELYDVEGFKKGRSSLSDIELERAGAVASTRARRCCTCSATSASTP